MTNVKLLYFSGLGLFGLWVTVCLLAGCQKSETGRDDPLASTGRDATENYVFYPKAPDPPRLQFLVSITTSGDLGSDETRKVSGFERFVLGEEKPLLDRILKPYGMAISEGKLYVCDVQKRAVEVLDFKARTFGYLSKERRMTNPVNLRVVNGIKYVADPTAGQVFVFGRDNELKTMLGADLDLEPIDVEVSGRTCYVTDKKTNQIVAIDISTGQVTQRIGRAGDDLGQFVLIGDMATDTEDNIYVTDKLLGRITKFNAQGLFQMSIGRAGDSIHHFVRPKGIDVDREGRIWVVDAAPEVAKVYNAQGQLLLYFGFPGDQPGSMNLPASILVDYDHIDYFRTYMAAGAEPEFLVFVSNQYGEKINVYAFGTFPVQARAIEQARQAAMSDPLVLQETPQPAPQRAPTALTHGPVDSQPATEPQPRPLTDEQRMQEIANLYYQSMYLYRNRQYKEARPGFETVLNSGLVPLPMARTIQMYLIEIDKRTTSGPSGLQ
jgi:sugar lactone lactonase YvrE